MQYQFDTRYRNAVERPLFVIRIRSPLEGLRMGRGLSFLMERGRLRGGSLFFVPERLGRGVEADQTAFLSHKLSRGCGADY